MTTVRSTLEVAKLMVSALIPLAIFGAGALLAREARKHEDHQWIRRKKYDTRLERWQEISPLLNDLLCFFMCFGHFRDVKPPDAVKLKRQLDRTVHANIHIFGDRFMEAYDKFMAACFETHAGVATDAKLRASVKQQQAERGSAKWDEKWVALFVPEGTAPRSIVVSQAYEDLLRSYDEL
jgi:hypothetical protein